MAQIYDYLRIFSELVQKPSGLKLFLRVRDRALAIVRGAGAARGLHIIMKLDTGYDSWDACACLDMLVDLGELAVLTQAGVPVGSAGGGPTSPDRIYVLGPNAYNAKFTVIDE